jgi:hypothetical protein
MRRRLLMSVLAVVGVFLVGCSSGNSTDTGGKTDPVTGPYSIRVMYVLPSDGVDSGIADNGAIVRSVQAAEAWLSGQTGGGTVRVDRNKDGTPAVSKVRLKHTDAEIRKSHEYVVNTVAEELETIGWIKARRINAIYYDGSSDYACSGTPAPLEPNDHVFGLYLHGDPAGDATCFGDVGASATAPGYWEFGFLHETLHALGIVAKCAPHETREGHVSDSSHDLMFAGDEPWYPTTLDIGRDDYFGPNGSACLDLADSVFYEPTKPDAQAPPGW